MELWVRSQNKEDLSKVEHLGIYNEKIYVSGYEENGYCIGIYKSKERALEVLDDIQNRIIELDKAVIYSHVPEEDYENVYEMPEE